MSDTLTDAHLEPASPTPFTIAINWDASVAFAPTGFTSDILAAVMFLETQFTNPVTITINVGYQEIASNALGRGDLGESLTSMGNVSYADVVNAVAAGATTATDASVAASLPASTPIGAGNLWVTTAQAKALGLPASALSNMNGSAEDGSIGFGAASQFTYGVTNDGGTVASGTYDFFATALHELTEVMGRQLLTGTAENGFPNSYTLMDLLHYSAAGKRDLSQFTPGYFSPDGGVSNLGSFNTNAGGDAGDWASSVRDDPFDAFAVSGVPETASSNDLTVMDAIGWRPAGSNGSSTPPVAPPVSPPVTTSVTSPVTPPASGLLGNLNVDQQLELIYVAYFNRAADGGGSTFWGQQNVKAQAAGQSATTALTNIASSFTPQPETIALYPFLSSVGTAGFSLNTPVAQTVLSNFIGNVYTNLFIRAADTTGLNYWVGQITGGAVGLGAAALAIANGATGFDAIEVQNKVAVAQDFTNRTSAAGLGTVAPLPASFVTAARGVLSGVDGVSLNDASVTTGESATTNYITNPASSWPAVLAMNTEAATPITISASNSVVDPGVGNYTIQFLAGTAADTLVLHAASLDQVSGFDSSTDVLDLRSLLSEANIDLNGDIASLGRYVAVVDQGPGALVNFDPTGQGGGGTVADLEGLSSSVTNLVTLIGKGLLRIA